MPFGHPAAEPMGPAALDLAGNPPTVRQNQRTGGGLNHRGDDRGR